MSNHPNGFPYVLFCYDKPEEPAFFLAVNEEVAKQKFEGDHPTDLVLVTNLIGCLGHQRTRAFLQQFGENWVCKDGSVFFPKKNETVASI